MCLYAPSEALSHFGVFAECRTEVSLLKYFAGPTFYYSFFRGSISITELSLDHYNSLLTMIYDSRQCWLTLQH